MKFTVIWLATAERELTELWLAASDRDSITRAANAIDAKLETAPQREGESRPDSCRILFEGPLGITFQTNLERHIVKVGHVWRFRGRNRRD